MGKLLHLDDYREKPQLRLVERAPMIPKPTSIVQQPLFTSADTLFLVRKPLVRNVSAFEPDHLVMPIVQDLDPFWGLDISSGWFNSLFPPCAAFFSVLRDYPKDLAQFVDGTLITYQNDYQTLLTDLNDLYVKARDHQGSGYPKGTLSEDEFIRLGSLFFIWSKTHNLAQGVKFDSMGDIVTGWCGEPKVLHLSYKMAQMYSDRLADCGFCSVSWKQFFFRAQNEYRESKTSWVFNLSDIDVFENDNPWDITFQEFVELLDFAAVVDPKVHQMTIVLPNLPALIQWVNKIYGVSRRLYVEERGLGKSYMAITNYKFALK